MIVNDDGNLYAVEGDCKHMKASLTGGEIRDGIVTCAMHGWRYRLDNGECLTDPAFRLKTYIIEIENDDIYVVLETS